MRVAITAREVAEYLLSIYAAGTFLCEERESSVMLDGVGVGVRVGVPVVGVRVPVGGDEVE